jgi:multiple sugar transport system substrate-binding protein
MGWFVSGCLGAMLAFAPLGARAADLVVWWEKGYYDQEDEAVREIVAVFEQDTGKHVELAQFGYPEIYDKAESALEAGQPPDFLFGTFSESRIPQWAYKDRLVDLESTLGPLLDLFDADLIQASLLMNGSTGRRGLYALPMARSSNHIHVWSSLLERAGFTRADIPTEWEAFWSFWCDEVQPAVRRALGRDNVWGVGLAMSATSFDTSDQLIQFQLAYGAPWIGLDRQLQVDDPEILEGMVRALSEYTAIWRKDCTPPDSVSWTGPDNNRAFLAQKVVMTANGTLSIPSALRAKSEEDYYHNVVTIDWPNGVNDRPLVIEGFVARAGVFKGGRNPALAQDFVRFLVDEGWLAHWLTFGGDRRMPPMRKLLEQPFWLDPTDPHRMRAAVQLLSRPHLVADVGVRDHEWRSSRIWQENIWGNAVHRVVTQGISPEQAVDEAIARIKQILSE